MKAACGHSRLPSAGCLGESVHGRVLGSRCTCGCLIDAERQLPPSRRRCSLETATCPAAAERSFIHSRTWRTPLPAVPDIFLESEHFLCAVGSKSLASCVLDLGWERCRDVGECGRLVTATIVFFLGGGIGGACVTRYYSKCLVAILSLVLDKGEAISSLFR